MLTPRLLRNGLISLILANILILIGKDEWHTHFLNPLHYLDMFITFLSVFIVFEYLDRANHTLNKKKPWLQGVYKRGLLQLFFGLVIPALLSILITFLQWEFIWHKHLVHDNYFKYEFLPQLLFIVVVNLCFAIAHLFEKVSTQGKTEHKPILIGNKGSRKTPISSENTSCIYLKNGVIYLINNSGDQLILSDNMDAYEKLLPSEDFFRANRQFIINKQACQSYKAASNGKIEVALSPKSIPILISQKRASSFRSWINSK